MIIIAPTVLASVMLPTLLQVMLTLYKDTSVPFSQMTQQTTISMEACPQPAAENIIGCVSV